MQTVKEVEHQQRVAKASVTSTLHCHTQQKAKEAAKKLSTKITKAVIEKRRTRKRLRNAQNCIYSVIDSLNSLSDYCDSTDDKRLIVMVLNALTKFSYCDYSAEELDADMLRQELSCEIEDAQFEVGIDVDAEARIDFSKNTLKIEY